MLDISETLTMMNKNDIPLIYAFLMEGKYESVSKSNDKPLCKQVQLVLSDADTTTK